MEDAIGVITMPVKFAAAAVTVKVAVDCIDPDWAMIVIDPDDPPVAIPAALMLAMVESDELHCTELVISFVVPSDMWAVAVNCWLTPIAIAMELGDT